jgi:hypothetical protein
MHVYGTPVTKYTCSRSCCDNLHVHRTLLTVWIFTEPSWQSACSRNPCDSQHFDGTRVTKHACSRSACRTLAYCLGAKMRSNFLKHQVLWKVIKYLRSFIKHLLLVLCTENKPAVTCAEWWRKMKMQPKVMEVIFVGSVTKEMCLRNPWNSPTEPQGSTEHGLKTTGLHWHWCPPSLPCCGFRTLFPRGREMSGLRSRPPTANWFRY